MKIKIYILILIIIFLILNIVSCEKVKDAEITTIKNEKSIEELNRELNPITIRNLNQYFNYLNIEDQSIDNVYNIFIDGNFAYLVTSFDGLFIIDIQDKYNPKIISSLDTPGNVMSVFIDGNYAYLADGESGLALIVSIEDKYNPKIISTLATSGLAYRICTSGNYAYLADGEGGLLVININDKKEPFVLEKIPIPTDNFFIEDNYAYIIDNWDSLNIVDLINRDYPEVVKSINIPFGCYEIITKIENNIYIIGGVSEFIIIDTESLNQPEINILDVDNVETALVDENIAYIISHYIDSDSNINRYIKIFDLTNKDEPDLKSSLEIQDEIYDIGKKDNHLFLTAPKGLKILEISDEYEISYGNNFSIPGNTYHIEIVDDFAFVSNSENGLMIIDISDIDNLKTISKVPNISSSFCIDGNYVYAATDFGLSIINISNKNNPIMINSIDTLGAPCDVYKANNLVYLVYYLIQNKDTQEYEWSNIIQVIDVSDIKDLKIIKNIKTPGYPTSVLVEGDNVYVSAYEVGLLVLNIKN